MSGRLKVLDHHLIVVCLIMGLSMGCAHRTVKSSQSHQLQRYGSVIGVEPSKLEEYKELHAAVWPDILNKITECNIRNYSIYLKQLDDDRYYLFSYFEYVGDDFEADMAKMAADPATQEWWSLCEPCQIPVNHRQEGEWWSTMEEVFHWD